MHGRGCSHDMGAGRNFWVSCLPVPFGSMQSYLRPTDAEAPSGHRQGYALETCRSPSHRAPFHMPASK